MSTNENTPEIELRCAADYHYDENTKRFEYRPDLPREILVVQEAEVEEKGEQK